MLSQVAALERERDRAAVQRSALARLQRQVPQLAEDLRLANEQLANERERADNQGLPLPCARHGAAAHGLCHRAEGVPTDLPSLLPPFARRANALLAKVLQRRIARLTATLQTQDRERDERLEHVLHNNPYVEEEHREVLL